MSKRLPDWKEWQRSGPEGAVQTKTQESNFHENGAMGVSMRSGPEGAAQIARDSLKRKACYFLFVPSRVKMQDSSRTKPEQRAYLERRNALWQKLRLLEPGDEGVEELLLELAEFTGQTRAQVERGLGWTK